jgi:hypothetical protein
MGNISTSWAIYIHNKPPVYKIIIEVYHVYGVYQQTYEKWKVTLLPSAYYFSTMRLKLSMRMAVNTILAKNVLAILTYYKAISELFMYIINPVSNFSKILYEMSLHNVSWPLKFLAIFPCYRTYFTQGFHWTSLYIPYTVS